MTETVSEGDLVEAVKGEVMVRDRAAVSRNSKPDGRLYIPALTDCDYLDRMEMNGWSITVIEKAAPKVELPTTPGLYLSAVVGDGPWVFELSNDGGWTLLNTNSPFPIGDGHLERNAPFTLLEPRIGVAKMVADWIWQNRAEVLKARQSDDVRALLCGLELAFGVKP